jgi:hypothetical protein
VFVGESLAGMALRFGIKTQGHRLSEGGTMRASKEQLLHIDFIIQ